MKKMLFTLTVLVAAAAAMTFTSCEKKETPGEQLDNAIKESGNAADKLTKDVNDAASETNKAVGDAINDVFSK